MNYRKALANKVQLQLQRGFYLFEMTIAMMVLASLMTIGAKQVGKNIQHIADQATAYHFQAVYEAAHGYVLDNLSEFDKSETVIDIQKLRDSKRLVNHIQDTNPYNQKYNIVVLQDVTVTPKVLKLLVATSGGKDIQERNVRNIAGQVGPQAGYASAAYPGKIKGSQGSWEMKASETSLKIKPGYLAGIAVLNEADVMDLNYFKDGMLYRKEMNGHPEYNRMDTDLTFGKNKKITFAGTDGKHGMEIEKDKISYTASDGSNMALQGDSYGGSLKITNALNHTNSAALNHSGLDVSNYNSSSRTAIKYNEIDMTNGSLNIAEGTYNSKLTQAEISLKNSNSTDYSYMRHDSARVSDGTVYTIVNKYGLGTSESTYWGLRNSGGTYSQINSDFVKVPYYHLQGPIYSWASRMSHLCNGGNFSTEGRMFVVGDHQTSYKTLFICLAGYPREVAKGG